MKTEVMNWFGMQAPIFAFSHCADVVAAVSQNGGLGTYGTSRIPVEQIERDLNWLASNCAQYPIGFDVVFPSNAPHEFEHMSADAILERIPSNYFEFVDEILLRNGLPVSSAKQRRAVIDNYVNDRLRTHTQSERRLELAYQYPNVKLIVSALGVPPQRQIDRAHEMGIKVAALVGHPKHVKRQLQAGVDILIAAGYEAGGHTGDIAGMVLTPQVVDAAKGTPVLHAGGSPKAAKSRPRSRWVRKEFGPGVSGWAPSNRKPVRQRKRLFSTQVRATRFDRARVRENRFAMFVLDLSMSGSATALQSRCRPASSVLVEETIQLGEKLQIPGLISPPAGQAVGMMHGETNVRSVMYRLLDELADTMNAMGELAGLDGS